MVPQPTPNDVTDDGNEQQDCLFINGHRDGSEKKHTKTPKQKTKTKTKKYGDNEWCFWQFIAP